MQDGNWLIDVECGGKRCSVLQVVLFQGAPFDSPSMAAAEVVIDDRQITGFRERFAGGTPDVTCTTCDQDRRFQSADPTETVSSDTISSTKVPYTSLAGSGAGRFGSNSPLSVNRRSK